MEKGIGIERTIARLGLLCLTMLFAGQLSGQNARQVNHQQQLWVSLNSNLKVAKKWNIIADLHVRRNRFASDPSFYFVRAGAQYWLNEKLTFTNGLAHMWLANPVNGKYIFSNENRIYQQLQLTEKWTNTGLLLRVRNEQRWQQKLLNGQKTDDFRFTNRFRMLGSVNFKIFKNPKLPRLLIADEVLVHMGKEIVYNAFDQNRITVGIQQRINKSLSFDFGYMYVYQQKYSGFQYDANHTLRLFFYYNPDFTGMFHKADHHPHLSGEE